MMIADDKDSHWLYAGTRRLLDLGFALFIFLCLNWLLLLIWLAIRRESPGPALFTQERIGQHGIAFTLYKFRTMQHGTKQAGTHEIDTASITRVGAFLRRTKLDELPQIWNILRNEMSLIGPRPSLPSQEELIAERLKRGVLALKPGITGLAQVNDIDMRDPSLLADWDARYLVQRGFLLDVKILFATAFGQGQGDRTKGQA